jgi:hypothetical protein
MEINGNKIPEIYLNHRMTKNELDIIFKKSTGLSLDVAWFYTSEHDLQEATDQLKKHFPFDDALEDLSSKNGYEYLEYINDFTKIVSFAYSGDGAVYCFDFRSFLDKPSVIWWDDIAWLKLADTVEGFFEMLEENLE